MNAGKREARLERIVVACDSTPVGAAALEAAAALAASLQAELAGLFVEDVNLLRMAALPFTRELGLTSALMRPIETTDIEREFRRHAELTRKALEDAALAASLRWSFQVVRGQPLTAVLSAAEEADLLVLGQLVRAAAGAAQPAAAASKGQRPAGSGRAARGAVARPVAVLYDGSARAARVLDLAKALAVRGDLPLALLLPAATADEFKALRERARAQLAGHQGAVRIMWLQGEGPLAVAQAAVAEVAAALLCHDPSDDAQLGALLAAVRCPLIIVR